MARQEYLSEDICRVHGGMGMTAEHDVSWSGPRAAWLAGDVLSSTLRNSLRELNARFLACLKRMPDEELGYLGFPPGVMRLLRGCEADSTLIMAACPYTLFDASFRQHEHWQVIVGSTAGPGVREEAWFIPGGSSELLVEYSALTEMVLFFAWHLATTNVLATRLVLGMSPATADLIRSSSLPAIANSMRTRRRLLRPRWPQRTLFWRRLLAITPLSTSEEATGAQLVGIQLMATEGCLDQLHAAPAGRKR
jgi:hypothetical protein